MKKILFLFLIFVPLLAFSNDTLKVHNGKIDISNWYFKQDGNLNLEGEWEFYWHKFLAPDDFKDTTIVPDAYASVPGTWTGLKINGKEIPDTGFATYRVIIHCDRDIHIPIKIFVHEILTSYRVFFNGKLLSEVGVPAKNKELYTPKVRLNKINIPLKKGDNELIFQIANYSHRANGFVIAPEIGEQNTMDLAIFKSLAIDVFILGILLIMAFYHLGIFFYIKNKTALIFSFFTLVLGLRILVNGNFLLTIIIPNLSWYLAYWLSYNSLYIGFALFVLYFVYTFNEKRYKIFFYSIYIISAIFVLSTFLPSLFYTKIVFIYQLILIISLVFLFYLLVKYIKNKVPGAKTLSFFMLILAITAINDILFTNGIIHTGEMVSYGLFFMILGQALTLARVFANAFSENQVLLQKLDEQNVNLEKTVEERTHELLVKSKDLEQKNEEITSINEQLKSKNDELLKYYQIIYEAPISIVITDLDNNIVYVNPFFEKITGYSKEEVLGQNPRVLNSGETPKSVYEELWNALSEGNAWTGEFINKKKNGEIFIEKAIISVIKDANGNIVNYLGLKEDITELKHKEEELHEKTVTLETLNDELNKVLRDLMAGLNYAQRIQNATFPSETDIKSIFDEYFLIYMPKETVGGDAYYFKQINNYKIAAIIDCTGHGVPGGFLSMMAISMLDNLILSSKSFSPSQILENIREKVLSYFKNQGNFQDGFDIGLAIFNTENRELVFSGANIPAYVISGDELVTLKAVRSPIGNYPINREFEDKTLTVKENDILYMTSDGFIDQFGNKGKYTTKRFKNLIIKIKQKRLDEQKFLLLKEFNDWKGTHSQIDDVTVIGVKLS